MTDNYKPNEHDVEAFGLDTLGIASVPPTNWAAARDGHLAALKSPEMSPTERQEHVMLALVAAVSLLIEKMGGLTTSTLVGGALSGIGALLGVRGRCADCGQPTGPFDDHKCPKKEPK
jgi:hypothetical protein